MLTVLSLCAYGFSLQASANEAPASAANQPGGSAIEQTPGNDMGDRVVEGLLRMTEFFDTTLPGTLEKYKLVLDFSPRLVDMRNREFIRFPFTLRYGVQDRWEIYSGLNPYSPNPLNAGLDHRWGFGEVSLGVRHDIGPIDGIFNNATIGLEARAPLGEPPLALTDRYAHVRPYIEMSRELRRYHTTLVTNFSYDRSLDPPFHDLPPPGVVRRNVFSVTQGFLYKPGEFGGSFEYSFRHFDDSDVGYHLGHEFKAGPIWDIPQWRTRSWGLPGKWQLDVAYRVTLEEGRKLSQGIGVRARWRTTLREVLSKKSYEKVPPR